MKPKPLQLAIIPEGWRLFSLRRADPAFLKFSEKIFSRDDYTCQYCGFKAHSHQEVTNLDHDYRNNKAENLVTTCGFCAQCFFLESVGRSEYGGGTLIYFPEVTQEELNGLCHTIFESITKDDESSDDSQSVYRSLKLRSKLVEKEIGEGTSSPNVLGQLLIDYPMKNRTEVTRDILKNLRLLPSREKFSRQIEDWVYESEEE